jgi:glutamate/tyrosine decarboxylase-like PLP-dependent enzyme
MVSAWDQNAAFFVQSPTAITLEEVALEWVRQLLGLPEGTGGAVVTGATMANFSALAAARHALLARAGWDVEADGLFGAPPITVGVCWAWAATGWYAFRSMDRDACAPTLCRIWTTEPFSACKPAT